jgi:hypothetical protein
MQLAVTMLAYDPPPTSNPEIETMRETRQAPQGTAVAKLAPPRIAQFLRRPRILKQIERALRAGAAGSPRSACLVPHR